ncbi:MAG: hypothetical protein AAGJ35_12100, partial [Myxococcota bacterium]
PLTEQEGIRIWSDLPEDEREILFVPEQGPASVIEKSSNQQRAWVILHPHQLEEPWNSAWDMHEPDRDSSSKK